VVEATGFELVLPDEVPESRVPDAAELDRIAQLDPSGLRFAEVPHQ
jgi:hypothetical protein